MTDHFSTIFLQQLCNELDEPRVVIKAQSPRFEVVVCNSQFVHVSQTHGQELSGKSMAEVHAWDNANEEGAIQIYDAVTKAIQTKTTVHLPAVRYDLTAEDGTVMLSWWQAAYEPLLNPDGTVEYLLCTTHNITALVEKANVDTTKTKSGFLTNS